MDADLAARLPTMSPRQVQAAARRAGIGLDPASALRRGRTARADRRVSIRPAPDTMTLLTGYVPVEQGVAAWANLKRHAHRLKADGDPRSLGAIMADTFTERLTGQPTAAAVPVEIAITMSIDSLLSGDDTPATLPGHGPIPAALARHLAGIHPGHHTPEHDRAAADRADQCAADRADLERAKVFLRRIFTDPINHTVVHVDTKKRRFDPRLARFIAHRDQHCRTPYCTAPIRHLDHILAHRHLGPTTATNGQGLCERDSHVKELPGWTVTLTDTTPHTTTIATPTGHTYTSTAPPALGPGARAAPEP